MQYYESINSAMHNLMAEDPEVVLLGEDLLDPYGGAFKVSKGLSTAFPEQVISTPISEQAIVGAAIGMAMRGMKPVVEIMFGDFITLCVDQIVNHASKYNWMFNEQINVPVVIRTPMGAGRGYGPTHSQSLESLFMSVPNLRICAPSIYHDPGVLLSESVVNEKHPVLFIENKGAYPKKLQNEDQDSEGYLKRAVIKKDGISETLLISPYLDESAELVIVTYGGMAEVAVNAALDIFMNEEILVHVLVVSMLRDIPIDDLLPQVQTTGRVLILEEGNKLGGWGAEVASQIHEQAFPRLLQPVQRMGSDDCPIPSALPLEEEVLPTKQKVIDKIITML